MTLRASFRSDVSLGTPFYIFKRFSFHCFSLGAALKPFTGHGVVLLNSRHRDDTYVGHRAFSSIFAFLGLLSLRLCGFAVQRRSLRF